MCFFPLEPREQSQHYAYLIDNIYLMYFFTGHKNGKRFLKCKTVSSEELIGKKTEQAFSRKLAKFSETVSHSPCINVYFPRQNQQVSLHASIHVFPSGIRRTLPKCYINSWLQCSLRNVSNKSVF